MSRLTDLSAIYLTRSRIAYLLLMHMYNNSNNSNYLNYYFFIHSHEMLKKKIPIYSLLPFIDTLHLLGGSDLNCKVINEYMTI